jgi:hypothetical protein
MNTIKIDDIITKKILDMTDIFENIHPNHVTGFGFLLNFIILYNLSFTDTKKPNMNIIAILFALRWIADCLDGNIARKYDKKSKFGNIFDTVSDNVLLAFFIYYLCSQFEDKSIIITIVVLSSLYFIYNICYNKIFICHEKLKNGDGMIDSVHSFFINNSFLIFIAFFCIIKNIDKVKIYIENIKIYIEKMYHSIKSAKDNY